PISTPPCDAARMLLRKKAIPHAHNAVAEVIKSSSMTTTSPTALNILSTKRTSVSLALSVAIQVIDCPIAIAVLGIARTTLTLSPSASLISQQETPEATETTI